MIPTPSSALARAEAELAAARAVVIPVGSRRGSYLNSQRTHYGRAEKYAQGVFRAHSCATPQQQARAQEILAAAGCEYPA